MLVDESSIVFLRESLLTNDSDNEDTYTQTMDVTSTFYQSARRKNCNP